MEKFGIFKYEILENEEKKGWYYKLYTEHNCLIRESKELFQYEGIARFAAIGHISLLENEMA